MNIQQHAQNILDLCTAGPIQGGISIEIKREAQAIVDSFEWFDCNEELPAGHTIVVGKKSNGDEGRCYRIAFSGKWSAEFGAGFEVVKWRELI